MTSATNFLGDVCVLGAGRTGEAVCRYLAMLVPQRVGSVTLYGGLSSSADEMSQALEAAGVRCVLGTESVAGAYDLAIASPGISEFSRFFSSAREHAREVIGEPEFAFRESPARWVGITGTNGKTTTTTLTAELLRAGGMHAQTVGNIGTIVTGELASREEGSWFVAELSSFQLATAVRLHPRVACLLNVTPDHTEWHRSLEAYAAAKERIFANLTVDDLAVVSVDDAWCRPVSERLEVRGLRVCQLSVYGEPDAPCAAFLRDGSLVVRLDGTESVVAAADELPIKGEHNVENALAASAMALELGVSVTDIHRGLLAFHALEHRIEPCGEVGGVRFVNDSKATNTDSVEKALTAFPSGTIDLLLGGHDKGTELSSLASAVAACCRVAVCYGEAGERIACALERAVSASGSSLDVIRAPHMTEAFVAACGRALPGDTVLLSPACSSFDEFGNMAERGDLFKRLVAAHTAEVV